MLKETVEFIRKNRSNMAEAHNAPHEMRAYLVEITHGEVYLDRRLERVMLVLKLLILIIAPVTCYVS